MSVRHILFIYMSQTAPTVAMNALLNSWKSFDLCVYPLMKIERENSITNLDMENNITNLDMNIIDDTPGVYTGEVDKSEGIQGWFNF